MPNYPVTQQIKSYTDPRDGSPLNGTLRFGIANQDPEATEVEVFWDAAGTQPAAQPIRVRNGFALRGRTPANVFANGDFSAIARDTRNRLVYAVANSVDIQLALSVIGAGTAAAISVTDAGAYYTGDDVEEVLQEIGASLASVVLGAIPTGVTLEFCTNVALPAGFVWESGQTIGNAASGAVGPTHQRANADTSALFTLLWNGSTNTELPIQDSAGNPTTRGASAAADFGANKRMPTPDRRGRTGIGKDNMGGTAANRVTVAGGNFDGTIMFQTGGTQNHTLTLAQTPAHAHSMQAHTHTIAHTHTATQVAHSHSYPCGTAGGGVRSLTSTINDVGNIDSDLRQPVITVSGSSAANSGGPSAADTNSLGGGGSHPNVQPSIVKTYIIKL
jgi:microcystin-dependent protein